MGWLEINRMCRESSAWRRGDLGEDDAWDQIVSRSSAGRCGNKGNAATGGRDDVRWVEARSRWNSGVS